MRILLVDNLMIRRYGRTHLLPGRKLMCGCIRNNWRICEFSDRDVTRYLAPLGIRTIGAAIANSKLIKTAINFQPDIILIGHCDYITNETLYKIRDYLPAVRIAHFNIDAIWQEWTCEQIERRKNSCDAIFVTSAGPKLKQWITGKNVVAYMPNPVDPSIECADNSLIDSKNLVRDFFFAGTPHPKDPRMMVLQELKKHFATSNKQMRYEFFGIDRPIFLGADYEKVLRTSKMSINLNRHDDWKWYSSDRIAHLMGSGILTFQSKRGNMQDFFNENECVFYDSTPDLIEKLHWYNIHDDIRRRIAHAGRVKYHQLFSGARILKFMVETLLGGAYSERYEWLSEVYQ
jgi:spore maturation protein CgeB